MFEALPKARADLTAGALYAVSGEAGWIYYGQVTTTKSVGFFRRRDLELADVSDIVESPIMAVISVTYPSIGRACRQGHWRRLGRFDLATALAAPRPSVNWPVGTLDVLVSSDGAADYTTRVDDPAIQDMELIAAWDAEWHIPARLTADFGAEPALWHVGGPIWRERRIKEERAARFPDDPAHRLPPDWVPTKPN